jgi:hypothetical protein
MVLLHRIAPLDRQQLRPGAGMALLPTPLAAAALAALRWLEPWTITGGWSGGVARRSADPLAQIGKLRSQGVELLAELIVLQLLSQDQFLTMAGVASRSVSARVGAIAGDLSLRCNRDSSCRQGFNRTSVRNELSRPMNRFD